MLSEKAESRLTGSIRSAKKDKCLKDMEVALRKFQKKPKSEGFRRELRKFVLRKLRVIDVRLFHLARTNKLDVEAEEVPAKFTDWLEILNELRSFNFIIHHLSLVSIYNNYLDYSTPIILNGMKIYRI